MAPVPKNPKRRLVVIAKETENNSMPTSAQFEKELLVTLRTLGLSVSLDINRMHDVRDNAQFMYKKEFNERVSLTTIEKQFAKEYYNKLGDDKLQKTIYRYFTIDVDKDFQGKLLFEGLKELKRQGKLVEEVWFDAAFTTELPDAKEGLITEGLNPNDSDPEGKSNVRAFAAPPIRQCQSDWLTSSIHPPDVNALIAGTAPPTTYLKGLNITVAVLDGGIKSTHPGLTGKISSSIDYSGSASPEPSIAHGTEVAGIIAGKDPLVMAIAPESMLMNVKISDVLASGDPLALATSIAQGLVHCAQFDPATNNLRAKVLNISWYLTDPLSRDDFNLGSQIEFAHSRGVITVFCAGNKKRLAHRDLPPKALTHCIIAGGVDCQDALWINANRPAIGSNFGKDVTVAGPADWVKSLYSLAPATNPEGTGAIASFNGTSGAAPHVAGLIAVMLSNRNNLTFDQIKCKLIAHAASISGTTDFGRIDMSAILADLQNPCP